jgi:hypothetical protein
MGDLAMAKRHRVTFTAEKPQPTRVKFETKDGDFVSFVAEKLQPTKVSFFAKSKK